MKLLGHRISAAQKIALIGIMAATLEGGKLALAALPNVEIITLLCGLYGYVFGLIGIYAIIIFVGAEVLIWGFNSWVISYLIYWPLVCVVFYFLGRAKCGNRFILTAAAVLLTVFFGVLTSLIDVGLYMFYFENFWYRFGVYYMRGIMFYAAQIISNIAAFLFLFKPLAAVLEKLKTKIIAP